MRMSENLINACRDGNLDKVKDMSCMFSVCNILEEYKPQFN